MRVLLVSIMLLVSGCSTLRAVEPDTLPIELTHVSHLSQHFGADPTSYGYDTLSIGAKWKPVKNLSISVSEGVVMESCVRDSNGRCYHTDNGTRAYGALLGSREVFTGRITYEIPLK